MRIFQVDFLPWVRALVLVIPVGFQGFASVADVVVVDFEASDVLVASGDMRGQSASRADRFQVFCVRDLHDFVLIAVPPVVFSHAHKYGDGDAAVPRCFRQVQKVAPARGPEGFYDFGTFTTGMSWVARAEASASKRICASPSFS